MSINSEINKRKTFGIISHPDAGKTTLTEKLLLYSGAIQIAGAVKSNKIKKTAASDFLEIEKQRGISVATSVLTFEYKNHKVNLLDTPGHKDFAEDTYRTLTAVDSVILVVDCVKGVEEQTEKLMQVCRMRNTPVIIFVNKLDREGKDPIEILDELESKLSIKVRPLTYPLGIGSRFKGVYNIYKNSFAFFESNKTKIEDEIQTFNGLDDPELQRIFKDETEKLKGDIELIDGIYDDFNIQEYLKGNQAPVFFGSALNNFGVKELLDSFLEISSAPIERETTSGIVKPTDKSFSGFVFKIHSNLDPKHRDRIAFLRVCSGKFERNKFYYQVRLNRELKFVNPVTFMAQSKSSIDEAYPGDVVGLYDSGQFKIGDTITEGDSFMFKGIPRFSPEVFRIVRNLDPFKSKQLEKGIQYLTDEGLAQLFTQELGNRKVIGVVGELQFEVMKYRLLNEYGAKVDFLHMNSFKAFWVVYNSDAEIEDLLRLRSDSLYYDKNDQLVFIANSQYAYNTAVEKNPKAVFLSAIEHNDKTFSIDNVA
ncbi:MAG: peptide chain release factor 3 [Melioribacteraceae bacterium]|nr:peptide chain release factor 3 [Melioribacteraceae bacterium]MCF8354062.1 peptide chain release factor 3 [Melioribacteraceae bacterium]MCF8393734.1 peptide chain release factor 3 [Melioribacteraceae bacterium]MCF8417759.1 peptide chain release factor 3 [Melioribacteraceae bacterium]